MLEKFIGFCLVVALGSFGGTRVFADAGGEKDTRRTARIKKSIQKLGIGRSAKVRLVLKNEERLRGYVERAGEDSFSVIDEKTGASTEIGYEEVKKLEGKNLSNGAKIGIGLGFAAAVLVLVLAVKNSCLAPYCE